MVARRIAPNLHAVDPARACAFYAELLDLEAVMDHDWIVTFADAAATMTPQVSIASEGGNGTSVPALSVEVDDADAVHTHAVSLGLEIVYPLVDEPWDVHRFYVHDPLGNVVNILTYQ